LLDLVGLAGYEKRAITSLSGGQAQRVALARSLAPHPRLLLLDEPLSALDRALREHLVGVLRSTLKATETTAIYVTHDQDEAFAVADRVAVLIDGRIARIGTPSDVWRSPASPAVATFVGYAPMLTADQARDLGWPLDRPLDRELVAVGPDGLVPTADSRGVAVPVREQIDRRGYVAIRVTLPHGESAWVKAADRVVEPLLRVALDPARCAVVAAAA
jgi:thiamine transport system ATP-binding protein